MHDASHIPLSSLSRCACLCVAMKHMSQIKSQQQELSRHNQQPQQPSGEGSSSQRRESQNMFGQLRMMARYHNIMASHTIHALQLLTSDVTSIFTHPTCVDRIAAMLNYFLCMLVSVGDVQLQQYLFHSWCCGVNCNDSDGTCRLWQTSVGWVGVSN